MGDIVLFHRKGGIKVTGILDVARFFLSKIPMSHLKLQKMCYYAQVWFLVIFGTRLFDEVFQAWLHGPVSPTLYDCYKQWGNYEIAQYTGMVDLDEGLKEYLEMIFGMYGGYSGAQLEKLTHSEKPWIQARDGVEGYCTNIISDESIIDYYKNTLRQQMGEMKEERV